MLDPQGVKDPNAGTPPASGVDSGTPPEDDVVFTEDDAIEHEGQKLVPLDVLIKIRDQEKKKREVLEARLQGPPDDPGSDQPPATPPAVDWDKLLGTTQDQSQQPVSPTQNTQEAWDQYNDQLRTMLDENPGQALAMAFSLGMQNYETLQDQANQFVPQGDLPVGNVTPQEVQVLSQNPHALRRLIALAKSGTAGPPESPRTPPQSPPQAPPSSPDPEKQRWIDEGRKQERELITGMGQGAGNTGEPPSGQPTASMGDDQLEDWAVKYFRGRGYTDEQIKVMTAEIKQNKLKKGMYV